MPASDMFPVPGALKTGQKGLQTSGVGPAFRLVQVKTLWKKEKTRSVDASVEGIHDSAL